MAARSGLGWRVLLVSLAACGDEVADHSATDWPTLARVDSDGSVAAEDGAVADAAAPLADAGSPNTDGGVLPVADAAVVLHDASVGDGAVPPQTTDAGTTLERGPDAAVVACSLSFYRDADGDGFGAEDNVVLACAAPVGYVEDNTDCYDLSASAKPGQSARFSVHRGDGSFDYDCDGIEMPMSSKVAKCPDLTTALCPPPAVQAVLPFPVSCDYEDQVLSWQVSVHGWYQKLPGCGQSGLQNLSVSWNAPTLSYACLAPTSASTRIQACR